MTLSRQEFRHHPLKLIDVHIFEWLEMIRYTPVFEAGYHFWGLRLVSRRKITRSRSRAMAAHRRCWRIFL
jgi:hypothetical protein